MGKLLLVMFFLAVGTMKAQKSVDRTVDSVSLRILLDDYIRQREELKDLQTRVSALEYIAAQKLEFQNFYKQVFKLKVNFSKVKIPSDRMSFLQFMPQGLSYKAIAVAEKIFYPRNPKHIYDDSLWYTKVDTAFEERRADANYAIWHSGAYEPDDSSECVGKSPQWVWRHKIKTMTRLERGVFGLFIYWKYHKLIDLSYSTICAGSQGNSGPYVPIAMHGLFFMNGWRYNADYMCTDCRYRVVTSLK